MSIFSGSIIKLPERLLEKGDQNKVSSVRRARLQIGLKMMFETTGISLFQLVDGWVDDAEMNMRGRARIEYLRGLEAYAAYKDNQNQDDRK